MVLRMDVSDPTSIKEGLDAIYDKYQTSPDHVVNSAGIGQPIYSIFETPPELVTKVTNVNYLGTFLINKFVGLFMVKHQIKNGAIVNIGSVKGNCVCIGEMRSRIRIQNIYY